MFSVRDLMVNSQVLVHVHKYNPPHHNGGFLFLYKAGWSLPSAFNKKRTRFNPHIGDHQHYKDMNYN
jgi:hypothetical protein